MYRRVFYLSGHLRMSGFFGFGLRCAHTLLLLGDRREAGKFERGGDLKMMREEMMVDERIVTVHMRLCGHFFSLRHLSLSEYIAVFSGRLVSLRLASEMRVLVCV